MSDWPDEQADDLAAALRLNKSIPLLQVTVRARPPLSWLRHCDVSRGRAANAVGVDAAKHSQWYRKATVTERRLPLPPHRGPISFVRPTSDRRLRRRRLGLGC